jgi:hypothetical protein
MAAGRLLASVAVVAGALALTGSAGSAGPALHGTGTSTLTSSTLLSARQAGPNTFVEQLNTRADVGAFTGNVTEHLSLVAHPTGLVTFHAEAILDGTYAGCGSAPVTQSIHLEGRIAPTGELSANFATVGGAPVVVHGTVAGTASSNTAVFTIDYHC